VLVEAAVKKQNQAITLNGRDTRADMMGRQCRPTVLARVSRASHSDADDYCSS